MNTIKWWVDASYAAHDDMRGHTGGKMSMVKNGRRLIISISKNQNLNKKISTEEELIGADKAMLYMLWTRCFLEAQAYGIDVNVFYQYNTSAMLL